MLAALLWVQEGTGPLKMPLGLLGTQEKGETGRHSPFSPLTMVSGPKTDNSPWSY